MLRALLLFLPAALLAADAAASRQQALVVLEKLRPNSRENMNVNADEGQFLSGLVKRTAAKRALEIGTSNGCSGIWISLGLRETGGKLITLEIDPGRRGQALENFRAAGVGDLIDSRLTDALQELAKIEGPFDFVFIDAWKPDYVKYLELVTPKVRQGGIIAAHNTKSNSEPIQNFRRALLARPDLETEFVEPGPGGFSVSVKK